MQEKQNIDPRAIANEALVREEFLHNRCLALANALLKSQEDNETLKNQNKELIDQLNKLKEDKE